MNGIHISFTSDITTEDVYISTMTRGRVSEMAMNEVCMWQALARRVPRNPRAVHVIQCQLSKDACSEKNFQFRTPPARRPSSRGKGGGLFARVNGSNDDIG